MRFSSSVLVILVLPLLAGCRCAEEKVQEEGVTKEDSVHATLDQNGQVVIAEEKEEDHDTVSLRPGDRVAWTCDGCPPGTQFAVQHLHLLVDLEQVVETLMKPPNLDEADLGELQKLCRDLESAPAQEEARTSELFMKGRISFRRVGDAIFATRDLQEQAAVEPVEWAPPDVFVDAGERILSGPVPKDVAHGVWKFTWKVRLEGKGEDEWDPHLYTDNPNP